MNALLLNPALPLSFWSLDTIGRRQGGKALAAPLSLVTLAALLPQDWNPRLIDLNAGGSVSEEDWAWADTVLITGMLVQKAGLLDLVRKAKRRGKTVVCGGPCPTSQPEDVIEAGCDILVKGEAEYLMPALLEALEAGGTGRVIEGDQKPEMADSPTPRFDLLNMDRYLSMTVQTSRGCPYECEFCDITNLYGRRPRYKSPAQIIDNLDALYGLGWRGAIFICDDNFIGDKKYARDLLEAMLAWQEAHGMPFDFMTQASLELGQNPELIDLMTAANFMTVLVGVESPDEEVLRSVHKHQNVRNPLAESLINLYTNGLDVIPSFVIGFDGEKPGAGQRLIDFVEHTHIPVVALNTLHILPNTKLWDRLEAEGRLVTERTYGDTVVGGFNFVPTRPREEIYGEFVQVWETLYDPTNFMRRAFAYYRAMRPTRKALAEKKGEAAPVTSRGREEKRGGQYNNLKAFLGLSLNWGLRKKSRGLYWRQLVWMRRRHPSRTVKYLSALGWGENLERLTGWMKSRAAEALK